jgi:hypothetical protein
MAKTKDKVATSVDSTEVEESITSGYLIYVDTVGLYCKSKDKMFTIKNNFITKNKLDEVTFSGKNNKKYSILFFKKDFAINKSWYRLSNFSIKNPDILLGAKIFNILLNLNNIAFQCKYDHEKKRIQQLIGILVKLI